MNITRSPARACHLNGFTLVELMVVVVIIGILASVAYPSYTQYVVRASRQAAMGELTSLANLQEKIYLNSNSYAISVTAAYNGTSAGGLGKTSGTTDDGKYALSLTPNDMPGQSYTLTVTPRTSSTQASDGALSINSAGERAWGSKSW